MQFQSIIAVLSFALVVTAVPTGPPAAPPPSPGGVTCQAGTTAALCNSTPKQSGSVVGGLIGLLGSLGIGPVLSCDFVNVLPIASGNQQAANACCQNNGAQTGLVNVGTLCVPIQA